MEKEFIVPKSVDILGTKYKIEVRKVEDDTRLSDDEGREAYTNAFKKLIVLSDYSDESQYPYTSNDIVFRNERYKHVLKHEIVHAFVYECGLGCASDPRKSPLFFDEQTVDWIAIQGPKLYKIWEKLGLVD